VSNAGGTATAVCIDDAKQPTWRIFCDDNGNTEHDAGENKQEIQGKCKKLKKQASLNC